MPRTRTPLCIAVHRSLLALCGAARCSPASHDGDDTAREDGAHGDHHPEVRVLAAPHLPGRSHSGWAALRHPSRPPPASLLEAPPVRGSERQCRSVGLPCLACASLAAHIMVAGVSRNAQHAHHEHPYVAQADDGEERQQLRRCRQEALRAQLTPHHPLQRRRRRRRRRCVRAARQRRPTGLEVVPAAAAGGSGSLSARTQQKSEIRWRGQGCLAQSTRRAT